MHYLNKKFKKSWTISFYTIIKFLKLGTKIILPNPYIFKSITDIDYAKILISIPSNIECHKVKFTHSNFDAEFIYQKTITNYKNHHTYIIYIHGGAFCMGKTSDVKNFLSVVAEKTNSVIYSINYRKAPEYKYPIPLDDCLDAYFYLDEKIFNFNYENKQIIIMGDSAGGNLAISLVARLIELNMKNQSKSILIPSKCILLSPWVNLTDYGIDDNYNLKKNKLKNKSKIVSSWELNKSYDFITPTLAKLFALEYINETTHTLKDVSPAYFSNDILSKLPPVLIECGECEVLYDQIKKFATKLKKLNVDVKFNARYEMIHNFPLFYFTQIPQAEDFFIEVKKFISNDI